MASSGSSLPASSFAEAPPQSPPVAMADAEVAQLADSWEPVYEAQANEFANLIIYDTDDTTHSDGSDSPQSFINQAPGAPSWAGSPVVSRVAEDTGSVEPQPPIVNLAAYGVIERLEGNCRAMETRMMQQSDIN
eukprot:10414209-Alexandrium_andersonii.AAC.1